MICDYKNENSFTKRHSEALKIKQEAEQEARGIMAESLDLEKRVANREQQLEQKEAGLNQEKAFIDKQKQNLAELKKDYEEKKEAILQKLEKVSQLSKDQAKQLLISGWEEKLKADITIFSSENEAGKQLEGFGGIACTLRFKIYT